MRRRVFSVIAVVCLGLCASTWRIAAQAPAAPLRQVAYLKASNPEAYDHFGEGGALPSHTGQTVAISGDGNTIAIGAPHEASSATGVNGNQNDNGAYNGGAVYVYTRNGGTWQQQAYVKASNAGSGDYFGSSVALSADGNTMAVAANWEASNATGVDGNQADNSIPQAGAVYIFTRSGGTWRQQAYLKASNTGEAVKPETVTSSASLSRSATTATRWLQGRSPRTATRPASTAIRRITRRIRLEPSMCSRGRVRPGRNRRTSSPRRRQSTRTATCLASRSR